MTDSQKTVAPTRLGRYEVVMKIASGGMATVYLGRMVSKGAFQRSVAIKVLHPELASDPGFVAMFLDEARLSAQIRHPNVVDVYDVDAEAGHLFIVMGYVEGASLYDLNKISRKQHRIIPRGIALRIMFDALTGLHAAHELTDPTGRNLDIIHRDFSPQNLLVGLDGVTRVSDFGVAKSTGRAAVTDTRDVVKGKMQYLAPEQMQRDVELDRRVDVFAAGVVFWELITSRPLFLGGTHAETLAAVLTAPVPRPSKYASDLGAALDDVCMKALERDPKKRFSTAGDFADALEEASRALMATPKTVGKFVRDIAPPKVGEGREAMRSSLDLSDARASAPSLTPLTPGFAPRKLTPAPIQAVAAAPKPLSLKRPESVAPPKPPVSHKPPLSGVAAKAPAPPSRKPPVPPPRRPSVELPEASSKADPPLSVAKSLPPPPPLAPPPVAPAPAAIVAAPEAAAEPAPVTQRSSLLHEAPAAEPPVAPGPLVENEPTMPVDEAPAAAAAAKEAAFRSEQSDGPVIVESFSASPARVPNPARQQLIRNVAVIGVAFAAVLVIGVVLMRGSDKQPSASASAASTPNGVTAPPTTSFAALPAPPTPQPPPAATSAQEPTPADTATETASAAPPPVATTAPNAPPTWVAPPHTAYTTTTNHTTNKPPSKHKAPIYVP